MNGSFRLADVGVIAAIVVNIIVGTWEIAHLDGRQSEMQRDQDRDEARIAVLETANAANDIHSAKVDNAIEDIKGQVNAIFDSVQRIEQNTSPYAPPEVPNKAPNFTPRH